MAYHGNLYILLFLPAAVILYSLVPVRGRRLVLLLANILFYVSFSRFLLAFRKHPCERDYQVMTIGDEAYKQLTGDFYL